MADLKDDIKTTLQTTSMSDVVTAGRRALDSAERGIHSGLSKARRFVSERTPESLKQMYREARGYTNKRSQTGRR